MNFDNSNFVYSATLKLNELGDCRARTTFPGVSDLAVNSRNFHSYIECVNSAKTLMSDIISEVNQNGANFVISTEVNPIHSGTETRSRDWGTGEMARFWIFDKKEEGRTTIRAVGQARIFVFAREPAAGLN